MGEHGETTFGENMGRLLTKSLLWKMSELNIPVKVVEVDLLLRLPLLWKMFGVNS